MRKFREVLLIILFPFFYILIDIGIRYKYIVIYSKFQMMFYIISIIFSILIYLFVIVLMAKNRNGKIIKYTAGLISSFYYSFTILSSYTFVLSTGIFPNYYTLNYFKYEPANAFSLLKDSIHPWQILVFTFLFILYFCLFMQLSKSGVLKVIAVKVKPGRISGVVIILLIAQIFNIRNCDQCMIVDANFLVDAGKHLSEWNKDSAFIGDGLPLRKPVKLTKINREPDFNILLIVFESLRTQNMQIYGYNRETTPFLSSLYKTNPDNLYVFKNTYTVSTTTMLAVPAILSGVTPEQPFKHFETFPLVWEYAEMLNCSTFFISSQTMKWYRFDKYYLHGEPDFYWNKDNSGLPSYNDSGVDDRLMTEHLNKQISDIAGKPFFGVVQFNATHFPYKAPEEFSKWDEKYIDKYDNAILYQDNLLKEVFSNLSKNGLLTNTVVIMVGDHGEAFKEHNSIGHIDTYNSETVSIPLIMYIPEKIKSQVNSAQLKLNTELNTSNADIVPTIINLLGIRNNREVVSIYPDLTGKNLFEQFDSDRSIITINSNEIINFNSGVSLIKNDYHYILRTNIVPYTREFFNIRTDSSETNNLIEDVNGELIEKLNIILAENLHSLKVLNLFYPEKKN